MLENVAFPLQGRGAKKAAREEKARTSLAIVGLEDIADM